nr:PREDICTED: myb family transcription factor PHL11-like isoform X5 [Musa acuminata subsp. malaccensis]
MGTNGLMFYHLKSHLQKYRLGKQTRRETSQEAKKNGSNSSKTNCSSTTNSDVSRTDGVGHAEKYFLERRCAIRSKCRGNCRSNS